MLVLFCLAFIMPGTAAAEESTKEELSIQTALEMAFRNNPDFRLAELEVRKAELQMEDIIDLVDYFPTYGRVTTEYSQVLNAYYGADIGLKTAQRAKLVSKDKIAAEVIAAYAEALINENNMHSLQRTLANTRDLYQVSNVANRIGFISTYDYDNSTTGLQQMEEGLRASQLAYEGSIANLRTLLGQHPDWTPVLTSEALITEYARSELSNEIIVGASESVLVWTKEALLDIEKNKEFWFIPGLTREMQEVNLDTSELSYADAKRTARLTIEQMYYRIDTIEGQIDMVELDYKKALKEEKVARLKYDLGLIPRVSLIPGADNLESAVLATSQAATNLSNLKLQLAGLKSQYTFMTGREVFDAADWSTPPMVEAEI